MNRSPDSELVCVQDLRSSRTDIPFLCSRNPLCVDKPEDKILYIPSTCLFFLPFKCFVFYVVVAGL
jgi:hypothetical protein